MAFMLKDIAQDQGGNLKGGNKDQDDKKTPNNFQHFEELDRLSLYMQR